MTKTNAFERKLSWWGAFGLLCMMCGCGASTTPQTTGIANLVATDAAAGACLIEYNDALTTGDLCCLTVGGANTCDLKTQCNAQSGSDCCLFYSTENTTLGQTCCRYSNNQAPHGPDGSDITVPCNELLSSH